LRWHTDQTDSYEKFTYMAKQLRAAHVAVRSDVLKKRRKEKKATGGGEADHCVDIFPVSTGADGVHV
jgi:hypothetical protein